MRPFDAYLFLGVSLIMGLTCLVFSKQVSRRAHAEFNQRLFYRMSESTARVIVILFGITVMLFGCGAFYLFWIDNR